ALFPLGILFVLTRPASAAVDPVTPDHPLWIVPRTTDAITIDGQLNEAAWSTAFPIVRTQAWRDDGRIVIRLLYSTSGAQQGLFVSASVQDENVWVEGSGGGTGNSW